LGLRRHGQGRKGSDGEAPRERRRQAPVNGRFHEIFSCFGSNADSRDGWPSALQSRDHLQRQVIGLV
jgi:hypothetical protein